MRLLYFSRDYSTHDHRFLSALAGTEHKVYYLRLERRGEALEDRPVPAQVEQVDWAGGRAPVSLRDGPKLLSDLRRVLRQVSPDLVHAGPVQRSAMLAALAGCRPLVSMSWGYDLIADARRGPLWRWATRYTLSHSAVLIGDSIVVRQLAQRFGMPDERIVTFPWGVDLQHFTPRAIPASSVVSTGIDGPDTTPPTREPPPFGCGGWKRNTDSDAFTILSTRRWEPLYGVEAIARAFVEAAQHAPQLRLIMLGSGSQAGLLRRVFAEGGVTGRVSCPGHVPLSALPSFYRSADLYVSASSADGASISLLEALACGLPALVSDIPGNREWITPNEPHLGSGWRSESCGWLFPLGDTATMAERMLHAASSPEELSAMRPAARALAEERADWRKNFTCLLRAYELAVRGGHTR